MAANYVRGEVVLTLFPFTDLSGSKVRPALVVSDGAIGDDVILIALSSVVRRTVATDFLLETSHADFADTGLKVASVFRTHSLLTVERSVIARRLGHVSATVQAEIDQRLRVALVL